MKRALLLGCGSRRVRVLPPGNDSPNFEVFELVTIDNNPAHNPDVVFDLNEPLWPGIGEFDEVHAYEVLEHLGKQGDAASFFATFREIYILLKPGGMLYATVPMWNSVWAWGDPSHTRIISHGSLVFLDQTEYKRQVGVTPMSDFRHMWKGDFAHVAGSRDGDSYWFGLEAVKPPRIT